MIGLFGTLNMAARAMQAQMAGVQVSGQNLANVNTTGYSRQVVQIQTSPDISSTIGPEGTGADAVAITQVVNTLLNSQIQAQQSVSGYWNGQQSALQSAQTELGEFLNGTGSTDSATSNSTTGSGLSTQLDTFFNDLQAVAASPTSVPARQTLINDAQTLATSFNQVNTQLAGVQSSLNSTISTDVSSADQLLTSIAQLNQQISAAQVGGGNANDLMDEREQDLESLSQLTNFTTSAGTNGAVNISIGTSQLVVGSQMANSLQTYDPGNGNLQVKLATGYPLTLTGGAIQGTIDARDGTLATLQSNLNSLASNLITQVNSVYSSGYSLTGTTGANFFTGTDASNISVDSSLANDPSLFQASASATATGDNTVALQLAQLATTAQAGLNNETFGDSYDSAVANLGSALQNANNEVSDQTSVNNMLQTQRSNISGVSVDQEMTNLMTYQRAYEASAQLVTTINTMMGDVIAMKTS